ncbi:D-aminoacylase [Ruegeria sp. ANG10]|uniref:N-acyl-D-amino-acid deacylase family protein n=1 Tax=Ruegeria sp. ANG10 TaxID=3042467 RepID=UPI003456D6B8
MPEYVQKTTFEECDLLIRNASVIDGTGGPISKADVAVSGDEIVGVGLLSCINAQVEIDATELCLAPGFIDAHTHDDWALLRTPDMRFKVTQGVTTVVVGNCGISAAPFRAQEGLPDPFNVTPEVLSSSFETVTDYRRAINDKAPAINVRLLAGHSALRATVMGPDLARAATGEEINQMAEMLDKALTEGAAGLSSGLDYPAAIAAPMEEVVTLARVLRHHPNTVYTTHVRDEGDGVIEAIKEALATGQRADVPLILSHHKCAGARNFGKSKATLAMIDAARMQGEVALDVYPYTASSSALMERFIGAAKDVLVIWSTPHPECGGRTLNDIAAGWDVSREEACAELKPAGAIYFDMDEQDVQRILRHPAAMIGSDGLPGTEKPHPRLWGTFPRVLGHYARDLKLFSLAKAVQKMTGLTAAKFGLIDRGEISVGKKADLVLFDAEEISDLADFDAPEQPAKGIHYVLVNGQITLSRGRQTRTRAGRFLSSQSQ